MEPGGYSFELKIDQLLDYEQSLSNVTVEAVAKVSNILGRYGYKDGYDFTVVRTGHDIVCLRFRDRDVKNYMEARFQEIFSQRCPLCGGEVRPTIKSSIGRMQCQKEPDHYLTLPEWSSLQGKSKEEQAEIMIKILKERQVKQSQA